MRVNAQTEGWRDLAALVCQSIAPSLTRPARRCNCHCPAVCPLRSGWTSFGRARTEEEEGENGGKRGRRSSVLVVRRRPLTLAMEASLREKDGQRTREGARERQNGPGKEEEEVRFCFSKVVKVLHFQPSLDLWLRSRSYFSIFSATTDSHFGSLCRFMAFGNYCLLLPCAVAVPVVARQVPLDLPLGLPRV